MSVAIITGSCGLVGSEAAEYFVNLGFDVVGIDNNMRAQFFGEAASTAPMEEHLRKLPKGYFHSGIDIRQTFQVERLFSGFGENIKLIIHAAAQPSHDWAATNPTTDWQINATGTHVLLEAARKFCPEAVFIFLSTNKVYGDRVNLFPLTELETRFEMLDHKLRWMHDMTKGVPESMPLDQTQHSLFGVSKLAADLLVQEYGLYFGMKTACFRCGCITGPNHAGAAAHGFLSYLMKCAITGGPYVVHGYKGKQVRDNIHAADLVQAFKFFYDNPGRGDVFNMGGGRHSNCSMLEAIHLCQQITGKEVNWSYSENPRRGDHIWWISDLKKFKTRYPEWRITYGIPGILQEIHGQNMERWITNA